MWCKRRDRKAARAAALAVAAGLAVGGPARADGLWDAVLEKMNIKAAPAAPGPDFVERTRPDPAGLGYLPTALPHKVSPRPVKSAAEIAAQKDALDKARERQLAPAAPVQLAKGRKPAKPAPNVAD